MSRIGKQSVVLPKGVEITVKDGRIVVKGPKGVLEQQFRTEVSVDVDNGEATVSLTPGNEKKRNFHGLYRALLNNMVVGVSNGFSKILEMEGVGYRAALKGKILELLVGFSNPVQVSVPEGVSVAVEKNVVITISGIDKQCVGQFAADVRSVRPPEPYKGKGIRYRGEHIRRKAGKAGKA